jgi:hypothetical protein
VRPALGRRRRNGSLGGQVVAPSPATTYGSPGQVGYASGGNPGYADYQAQYIPPAPRERSYLGWLVLSAAILAAGALGLTGFLVPASVGLWGVILGVTLAIMGPAPGRARGRGRSRSGGFLHDLEQDTRALLESDVVVALPGWRDCPESTVDVLTADGAGIPWGSLDDALTTR